MIGRSRTGLKVLISFGELRNELMLLENCLDRGEHERVTALALTLRRRCRVLAHALETASLEAGAASGRGERAALREEVLESFSPLAAPGEESARRLVLRDDWSQQLASSGRALAGDTVSRPDSGDPEARSSR